MGLLFILVRLLSLFLSLSLSRVFTRTLSSSLFMFVSLSISTRVSHLVSLSALILNSFSSGFSSWKEGLLSFSFIYHFDYGKASSWKKFVTLIRFNGFHERKKFLWSLKLKNNERTILRSLENLEKFLKISGNRWRFIDINVNKHTFLLTSMSINLHSFLIFFVMILNIYKGILNI